MQWRLLAVLGFLGNLWVLLFLPGCSTSLLSSRQQTSSPASTVVSRSTSRPSVNSRGGGRPTGRQTVSTTSVSPQQHTVKIPRSEETSQLETQETIKNRNECSCDVIVGSNETKEFLATDIENVKRYFFPEEDFHGISVELEVSFGTYSIWIPKEDLCVRNSSVWYQISIQAVPSYIGINKWAIRISVKNCTKTFRSPKLYHMNWFKKLKAVANGSSCWRTSLPDCKESSPDENNMDAALQTNAPPPADHETIVSIIVLLVILMIVVVAFLLIRRKVMTNSRNGTDQQNDAVHQSVSLAEVLERKGSHYDSQNSIYEAWTSDARGSAHDSVNSLYIAYAETGTGLRGSRLPAGSCVGAGIQEEPIYHNVNEAEVQ